ncbi:AgmX/PglI C-terminal domain-containing protein [bacterium]|nr:AgmX/PglI C-terminal domain-containing protein [bacterium]
MLRSFFKNNQIFISYLSNLSGIERFYPVVSVKKNMSEKIELDMGVFTISSSKSLRKGIKIIFKDDLYIVEQGKIVSIKTDEGVFLIRIIHDWTLNSNHEFPKFFYYSIAIHFLFILAFTLPAVLKGKPNTDKVEEQIEERVTDMISKLEAKNPEPVKKEEPVKEVKQIVVQKKEKQEGFWPSKSPKSEGSRPKRVATNSGKVSSSNGKSSGGASSDKAGGVTGSLDFLSANPSSNIAINSGGGGNDNSKKRGYGSGGVSVKGISKDSGALQGGGDYGGAIETKGIGEIKNAQYGTGGGGTGGGYSKTLNSIEGKVSAEAIGNSNKGGVTGVLRSGGSLETKGEGKISKSAIQEAINKKIHRLTYCYEKALLKKPTLSGIVKISWTIKLNRKVKDVKIVSSQIKDSQLHDCLTKEIAKISFPAPKGGDAVVTYPFKFKPDM